MKTNKDILDEFGKIVVTDVIDRQYRGISKVVLQGFKNPTMLQNNEIFNKLNSDEKKILTKFINENTNSIIFDFLRIFEEHEEFKIVYEEDGNQVDLNKISEMLKAEPIIENGWIERFSKEVAKDE